MYTGYVYKITNQINFKVYIGITTGTIEKRWKEHCKNYSCCKALKAALVKHGTDNFIIEVLENHCSPEFSILWNKLCYREQVNIAEYNSYGEGGYNCTLGGEGRVLGKNKESREAKQKAYQKANKEAIAAKSKAYRKANKEAIAAKSKYYYEANKEERLAKSKEYYKTNKEVIATRKKSWYEANKESILLQQKEYQQFNRKNKKLKECYSKLLDITFSTFFNKESS